MRHQRILSGSCHLPACRLLKFNRKVDALLKSPITSFLVIPAKAGIQVLRALTECLDPGFRRGDGFDDFCRENA